MQDVSNLERTFLTYSTGRTVLIHLSDTPCRYRDRVQYWPKQAYSTAGSISVGYAFNILLVSTPDRVVLTDTKGPQSSTPLSKTVSISCNVRSMSGVTSLQRQPTVWRGYTFQRFLGPHLSSVPLQFLFAVSP